MIQAQRARYATQSRTGGSGGMIEGGPKLLSEVRAAMIFRPRANVLAGRDGHGDLMAIIVRIDVQLALRKMSVGEFAPG